MKYIKAAAAIIMMLMLTSCVGEEPDNIVYVTALGIDKQDDGYVYTLQFAQPVKISGGAAEEGGTGGKIVENISVEAPTVYSAISNANAIISKNLSMSHAKIFVISSEIAKGGLKEINDVFIRSNDIRPDIFFVIAKDAGKYLENVKPNFEINPVKYYQLIYENRDRNSIPRTTAMDFYTSCICRTRDCLLPYAGVAKTEDDKKQDGEEKEEENKASKNESMKDAEMNKGGFEDSTRNYFAGQAGKKITNKSESLGAAVFKGDKYVGNLGSTDAELYNILINKFREISVTFNSGVDPESPITLELEEKTNPKFKIDTEKKHVEVYLTLESELLSAPAKYRESVSIQETNKSVSEMLSKAAEDLIEKLYGKYNVDAMGVRGMLRREFITLDEYDNYCKSFKPRQWSFSVHTNLKIKRTGMTDYH